MRGHSHRKTGQTGSHQIRDLGPLAQRQHQRQRSGPKGGGQTLGHVGPLDIAPGHIGVRDMHDQRVETGPALGLIDPRHRRAVASVAAQAVNCFAWEGDQPAVTQNLRRAVNSGVGGGQGFGGDLVHRFDAAF